MAAVETCMHWVLSRIHESWEVTMLFTVRSGSVMPISLTVASFTDLHSLHTLSWRKKHVVWVLLDIAVAARTPVRHHALHCVRFVPKVCTSNVKVLQYVVSKPSVNSDLATIRDLASIKDSLLWPRPLFEPGFYMDKYGMQEFIHPHKHTYEINQTCMWARY